MTFPLPPIQDKSLEKFCEKHNLYEAVAAGYHSAKKCFPKAHKIEIEFYPPYRDDEPEEANIIFAIETDMTVEETLEAVDRFDKAMIQTAVPGREYITTSQRFINCESS